jgi:TonB-dependent starch-binding outer membrane protein SusC
MKITTSRAATLVLVGVLSACAAGRGARPQTTGKNEVTSEDIAAHPNEPIEAVLQRKVSGVSVRRTKDGGIALQLRGVSSYTGAPTPPLYVVDDMPFKPGPDGALSGVDPYEIDSIKVLKGADAGIYGIEGASGVILIKTKRGGQPAKP